MLKTLQMTKLEHMILHLNSITLRNNYTQTPESSSQKQLMFTQPKRPKQQNKPAYKKYCSYSHRTNHSISARFKIQRDDEEKRDAYVRSKSPQKSFVQYFRSPSNDRTKHYDNHCRSRITSRNKSYNKKNSQNRYRSTSRDRFSYEKSTTLHNTLDHDMIPTDAIHGLTALHTDLRIDLL